MPTDLFGNESNKSVHKDRKKQYISGGAVNLNVDGPAGYRRDPAMFETLSTSDPTPAIEIEKKVQTIRKQYLHLSHPEALQLLIYRTTKDYSMTVSGNSGGAGRYAQYCQKIRVPY